MKLKEFAGVIRKLNLRKLANIFSVFFSYHFSRLTKIPHLMGGPISVSIEPTTSCNLRCPECPSGLRSFTRPTGMLELNLFTNFINENHRTLLYLNFYFQGEPFLNPDFLKMVRYASEKKIITSTSTNAHFLDEKTASETILSGLDRLIISIDGVSQSTYEQYRKGGNIEKVLQGARNIIKYKKQLNKRTPYLIFQFLIVKPNEEDIPAMVRLANEIGVDELRFKTAQIYDYENGNELIPQNESYSRYKRLPSGKFMLKNKLLNQCWRMWSGMVITWDGKVVPCCFDKDAKHEMGNIYKNKLSLIWRSERYTKFRKSILNSRKSIDICSNCSEGTKVWEPIH